MKAWANLSATRLADEIRISQLRTDGDILDNDSGRRFYFRHLSPRAKARKRSRRKMARVSRRANR